ncbi:MAG: bifunctional alpha/beta hydrolase/OsmC family protein [Holophagae bacterium]
MHIKKITFKNSNGQSLAALLDMPVDDAPVAYALFAHCFTCSKDYKGVARVSRALAAEGVAVLRFDFTGLGQSQGDFADTTFSSNVEDLVAAASFMERELESPAVLIGHSLGGAAVLQAASRIPSARAVATIGAPSSTNHLAAMLRSSAEDIDSTGEAEVSIGGRSFRIRREMVEDLSSVTMEAATESLGRALLVLHSPVDDTVGIEHATAIFRAAKHPKSFVSLDTADHLLTGPADARYVGAVIAGWSRRYLDSDRTGRTASQIGDDLVVVRTEKGGFRTEVLANGHPLTADEPESVGGTDAGPSPYELLSAALGACTTMTLQMYAGRKRWPLEAAEVRLRHAKVHCEDCADAETGSARIDRFERALELEGDLEPSQRARLLEIADRCPVHQTLTKGVEIVTTMGESSGEATDGESGA